MYFTQERDLNFQRFQQLLYWAMVGKINSQQYKLNTQQIFLDLKIDLWNMIWCVYR